MITYSVKLEPQKEGGYTTTVPALPGCISEGDTLDEALRNISDAIEGYIKVLAKHERKIPLEVSGLRKVRVFKRTYRDKAKAQVHAEVATHKIHQTFEGSQKSRFFYRPLASVSNRVPQLRDSTGYTRF